MDDVVCRNLRASESCGASGVPPDPSLADFSASQVHDTDVHDEPPKKRTKSSDADQAVEHHIAPELANASAHQLIQTLEQTAQQTTALLVTYRATISATFTQYADYSIHQLSQEQKLFQQMPDLHAEV